MFKDLKMKRVKGIYSLICLICLSTGLSTAQAQVAFGTPNCGQWTLQQSEAQKGWLLGYISGMNKVRYTIGNIDDFDILKDGTQAILWVNNYCKSNPLETVADAANSLAFELFLLNP